MTKQNFWWILKTDGLIQIIVGTAIISMGLSIYQIVELLK